MKAKLTQPGSLFKIPETIVETIREKETLANRDLLEICGEREFIADTSNDPHLPHELAETALNPLIQQKYGRNSMLKGNDPERECLETLRPLCNRLPVQSWRSGTQIMLQQLSTPAVIAYLMAYLMN